MAYTTIDKPSDYFEAKLWSGNATDDRAISGLDFAPNWVWIKNRTDSNSHAIFDTVRGATKYIESDTTDAEATGATFLKSFTSDGFTLGTAGRVNANSQNYVAWNWLAGGSASSNTDGSITSTVSANTTSGFSIVSWTGSGSSATIGHGLGSTPKFIIVKNRTDSVNWFVYHNSVITASATNKSFMTLNTTDALGTNGSATTFTSVSDTTFGVGTDNIINGSSDNMIAYVFADTGNKFFKAGSYVGNGSNSGTYIHTGFSPSFVIMKRTDSSGAWYTLDNKRPEYNPKDKYLSPNSSNAEATFVFWDFLSSGFKIRNTGLENNASGGSYIYMAFAESPFVTSTGIPTTAR